MAHKWFKKFDFWGINSQSVKSPFADRCKLEITKDNKDMEKFDQLLLEKERECDCDINESYNLHFPQF